MSKLLDEILSSYILTKSSSFRAEKKKKKKVLQIENNVMTLAFSLCNKWTQVNKEKLRQDGHRKRVKERATAGEKAS